VIVQPDDDTLTRYRQQAEQGRHAVSQLQSLHELPAQTACGEKITLMANIEFPREADAGLERGADGIGLYRTEFLYLGSQHEPSEEDHYQAYARVVKAIGSRPVVIRTLDLGADKMGSVRNVFDERNPFLGLRSIRMSLRNLPLFRTQLRAILRASTLGDVRVMFPLISTLDELRRAKAFFSDVMEDLDDEGVEFNRDISVGMMVEVPATVLVLERFAKEVDFFSIGTNDLVQYTLAVDRGNKEVASLYNNSDPAVLRLLKMAMDVSRASGVPTSLCGQMCSSEKYTMLLLGLGLRILSVPPIAISKIKAVCRAVTLKQCRAVAETALEKDTALEVRNFLKEELRRALPPLETESTSYPRDSLTT
jgi:phosphotransferase system enzyme I (PtsI)